MKKYYDLHIHSALSPCSDDDLTPANIVMMAKLKGLDIIAIADHNSILNVKAAMKIAKDNNILLVPAMELETKEEVHILCLFENIKKAEIFAEYVDKKRIKVGNNKEIFGAQLVFDENDTFLYEYEDLLSVACDISIEDAIEKMNDLNSIAIPAHIDRESFSIITNLGFISPHLNLNCVEMKNLSKKEQLLKTNKELNKLKIISNSDAHSLGLINEKINYFEDDDILFNSPKDVIQYLKKSTKF